MRVVNKCGIGDYRVSQFNPKLSSSIPIMKRALILLASFTCLTVAAYAFDASASWADQCAKCHGKDGAGDTKMGKKLSIKDYTDAKVQAEMKDEDLLKLVVDLDE